MWLDDLERIMDGSEETVPEVATPWGAFVPDGTIHVWARTEADAVGIAWMLEDQHLRASVNGCHLAVTGPPRKLVEGFLLVLREGTGIMLAPGNDAKPDEGWRKVGKEN